MALPPPPLPPCQKKRKRKKTGNSSNSDINVMILKKTTDYFKKPHALKSCITLRYNKFHWLLLCLKNTLNDYVIIIFQLQKAKRKLISFKIISTSNISIDCLALCTIQRGRTFLFISLIITNQLPTFAVFLFKEICSLLVTSYKRERTELICH